MDSKSELRKLFLAKRQLRSKDENNQAAKNIVYQIQVLEEYQKAKTVALYLPFNNEVSLLGLLDDDKNFCFPKVISYPRSTMDFFEAGESLTSSVFGMEEPTGKYIPKNEIDLFLVPGLVFSRNGERIGYGKGFYDIYLKDVSASKIGICYHFQIIDSLPISDFDISLDKIVSEEEVICIQP